MKITIYVAIDDLKKMAEGHYEGVRWDFDDRASYEYQSVCVCVSYEIYRGLMDLGDSPKQLIKG